MSESQAHGPNRTTNLAMVALDASERFDLNVAGAAVGGSLGSSADSPAPAGSSSAVVAFPGGQVALGLMPSPIPWGDLEWPVQTSWHWPEARTALQAHRAHVIVFASSESLPAVGLALVLSKAVAAIAGLPGAIGVYYGNAALVLPAERYVYEAAAASADELPLGLWLGLHPVHGEAGWSAYTTGMSALGYLDLEVHDTDRQPGALLDMLANIAHYELAGGVQIGDGQTVGPSAEERHLVRHLPSRYGACPITCQFLL